MKNKAFLLIIFLVACIIFLIVGLIVQLPPMINNIIYGIMALFGIPFLINQIGSENLKQLFKKPNKNSIE